ncbi:hypothetical protein PAHAL_2G069900 [Panicum hallii]|uniref:Uncharacterized protein n=1 Tax=Panicum hallii TaxID=206008 RepID=A0A2T8KN51_9POAL|nr:hypothetical protein PAHAL_2G069900 [Panicum hallii]
MSNMGALANFAGDNNWQYLQFFRTMRLGNLSSKLPAACHRLPVYRFSFFLSPVISLSLVPPGPWGFQRRGSSPARRPTSPPGASSGSSPLQPSSPTGDSRRRRPSPPPFSPGGGAKGGREELRQAGAEGRSCGGLRRSAWRGGAARSGAEGWRCGDGRRGGEERRGLARRGGAAAAGAEGRGHGRPAQRGGVAVGCARRGWRFGTDGKSSDGRRGGVEGRRTTTKHVKIRLKSIGTKKIQ